MNVNKIKFLKKDLGNTEREKKLAKELRKNLKRRKMQAQNRSISDQKT